MTPTLTELESRLDAICNNIIVAKLRLSRCTPTFQGLELVRATQHLQAAATSLHETIVDLDGLRLDLLQPTREEEVRHDAESVEPQSNPHNEVQPYADWDRDFPGWADRIHDAIEEGD